MEWQNRGSRAAEGFVAGAAALQSAIVSGVTGIVVKPLEGAEEAGLLGFLRGTVQGLSGVVVKPVAGVLDFAAHTTAAQAASAALWQFGWPWNRGGAELLVPRLLNFNAWSLNVCVFSAHLPRFSKTSTPKRVF